LHSSATGLLTSVSKGIETRRLHRPKIHRR
jgi:hypothetical protein